MVGRGPGGGGWRRRSDCGHRLWTVVSFAAKSESAERTGIIRRGAEEAATPSRAIERIEPSWNGPAGQAGADWFNEARRQAETCSGDDGGDGRKWPVAHGGRRAMCVFGMNRMFHRHADGFDAPRRSCDMVGRGISCRHQLSWRSAVRRVRFIYRDVEACLFEFFLNIQFAIGLKLPDTARIHAISFSDIPFFPRSIASPVRWGEAVSPEVGAALPL